MISSEHAVHRIQQLSKYCLAVVKEHEQEAEQEAYELNMLGADVEANSVTIQSVGDSVYFKPHRWIEFYSKFL